jgi:hypothetical protein
MLVMFDVPARERAMTKAEGKGKVIDLKALSAGNLPIAVCTRGKFPYLSCLTSISLSA